MSMKNDELFVFDSCSVKQQTCKIYVYLHNYMQEQKINYSPQTDIYYKQIKIWYFRVIIL